jgi:excisionase family DNA binding protein
VRVTEFYVLITTYPTNSKRDRILTDRETADLLQVPLSTLRGWWANKRGPPSFKCGRHRRVLESALMAWCEAKSN